jgi:hypothetical protein
LDHIGPDSGLGTDNGFLHNAGILAACFVQWPEWHLVKTVKWIPHGNVNYRSWTKIINQLSVLLFVRFCVLVVKKNQWGLLSELSSAKSIY